MKYILVLGTDTENREMFGGIVDYSKIPETDEEKELHSAIDRALSQPDPLYFGEATAEGSVCDQNLYKKYPFEGKVDTFVRIFVD